MYGYAEIQKKKKYYQENKEIIKQKRKVYVLENIELVKKCNKLSRQNRNKPPRKIRAKILKSKTEMMIQRQRNKCNKLGLQNNNLTLEQWKNILELFDGCAFCGNKNVFIGYVISFSRNGSFCLGNIVTICSKCRSSKKDRNLSEWNYYDIVNRYYPEKVLKLNQYINQYSNSNSNK